MADEYDWYRTVLRLKTIYSGSGPGMIRFAVMLAPRMCDAVKLHLMYLSKDVSPFGQAQVKKKVG